MSLYENNNTALLDCHASHAMTKKENNSEYTRNKQFTCLF